MNQKMVVTPRNNRFLIDFVKKEEVKNSITAIYYPDNVESESKYTVVKLLAYSGEESRFDLAIPCLAIVESFLLETVTYNGIRFTFCPVNGLICTLEE